MPARHSAARHHSHTVSLGAANPSHRITRRKSINSGAANSAAAVVAALQEDAPGVTKRRSLNLKNMASSRGLDPSRHFGPANVQHSMDEAFKSGGSAMGDHELAVADDFLPAESVSSMSKTKARRASEGSHLTKGEGKRSSGELRCEKCGKGYKHSSCLTKHLSVFFWPFSHQLLAITLHHFLRSHPFLSKCIHSVLHMFAMA